MIRDQKALESIKDLKPFAKIEEYILYWDEKNNKIIILGNKAIDLSNIHILELTYKHEYFKRVKSDIDLNIYNEFKDFKDDDIIYTVGLLTLEALISYKYTETLKLLTFYFKKKENALLFLDTLETLRILQEKIIFESKKETKEE